MQVAVCGDSYFSSDLRYPGQSAAEKFCQRHGHTLVSLAREGASNFCIALQIRRAVELGVDVIITNTTDSARFEFPIKDQKVFPDVLNWNIWRRTRYREYSPERGLDNVLYRTHQNLSSLHPWFDHPTIIATGYKSLMDSNSQSGLYDDVFDIERKKILKSYFADLHDDGIKAQYDSWAISDALHAVVNADIKLLIFVYPLFENGFESVINWLPDSLQTSRTQFNLANLPNGPACFHHSEQGAESLSDYWTTRL